MAAMKRDMELIRLLLLRVESGEETPELEQYDQSNRVYQAALMIDAGLVEGVISKDQHGMPARSAIIRLTWAGHDFLDAVRDNGVWKNIKDNVLKPGASWTFGLLLEYAKFEIKKHLPMT
jgi:hypothetical protein